MAQEKTTNTFTEGIVMDINEIDTPSNTSCSTALNACMATYNGNEGAILNEMGNVKINEKARLPKGAIPLGSVEYGGVIYYVLKNNGLGERINNTIEIGSFPSPDWNQEEEVVHNLLWEYHPLKNVGVGETTEEGKEIKGDFVVPNYFDYSENYPVNMLAEPSFDGSLNLILNDGKHQPRLINTGFHVLDNNTCKIIKRYNNNNTNRYYYKEDDDSSKDIFNLQTSLYRNFSKLSRFIYGGTLNGGDLKVGNYVFYAVSCDKDGNESDIICESGVISIFIGEDGNPFSVNGGIENQNSYKSVKLTVQDIDDAYSYIKLYYTRTTAQNNQMTETLAYKVDKLYSVKNGECEIIFTGNETVFGISISDLNIQYFNANSAKAQALNLNMLFLGNISQDNGEDATEYEILRDFSLEITPRCFINKNFDLKSDYSSETNNNYYNTTFIYNNTGYHDEEFYRFGIVYIRKDGSLTNVFDILGDLTLGNNETNDTLYNELLTEFENSWNHTKIIDVKREEVATGEYRYINNKGVCKFNNVCTDLTDIIGINFIFPNKIEEIKSKYKGFFFVRQKRIPTILALGYATDVCEEAFIPSINYHEKKIIEKENNTTEQKDIYYHLFESFVQGNFKKINNSYCYPASARNSKNTFLLNNAYQKRLFELSPYSDDDSESSYAFFDRFKVENNVFGEFYSFIGGNWNGLNELNSGLRYDIYGGVDDDKYLTLYSNNANPDGTHNYAASRYSADFYYFVKVNVVSSTDLIEENDAYFYNYQGSRIKLTKIPKSDSPSSLPDKTMTNVKSKLGEPTFEGWYLFDDREIYKDEVGNYYLIPNSNGISSHTGGNLSTDNNGNSTFVYTDDRVWNIAKYVCTQYWTDTDNEETTSYKFSRSPWSWKNGNDSTFGCPLYIEVDGNYYTYVAFGPGCSENHQSDLKEKSLWYLQNFAKNTADTEQNVTTSTVNTDKGIDTTVPTFDGKYQYTISSDINEVKNFAIKFSPLEKDAYAVYCPEYELNKSYYNNFFTGNKFTIKSLTKEEYLESNIKRLYNYNTTEISDMLEIEDTRALAVDENVSLMSLQFNSNDVDNKGYIAHGKNAYFSTKAGNASEVSYKFAGAEFLASVKDNVLIYDKPFNVVRGIYGAYVGVHSTKSLSNKIVQIYVPNYDKENSKEYVKLRAQNSSEYYSISDRISFESLNPAEGINCYRGDCYIGYFTHRVNRNFQDPTSPYNDTIINKSSFQDGFKECFSVLYRTLDVTKDGFKNFNLGDINAILLGSWVTFPVRSTMNISLRSVDKSYVDERLLCGNDRSFYPLHGIDASGSYKIPDSDCFNVGFNKSGGEKQYFNLSQLVYNKVYYKNRIVYSNVLQQSALTNGNRTFLSEHYKDYTDLYGEIVKLISLGSDLVCVCEYGIMLIPVNERALAAEGSGGNVFINTSNVLPDNPRIISDTFGSQWVESIVETPYGIYGVDEANKKIWYTDGRTITIISDFKVQEFLNNYLKVTQPLEIRKCNIKTHYVKYKNDVIFTLYDYKKNNRNDENLWSLCWNINERLWRTFYSWIPVDSLNIGNNLISIDLFTEEDYQKNNIDNYVDNYLWKHGHSSRVPSNEYIKPTNWYGITHPFEFEFVVKDNPGIHKIFDNLQIISNKAVPESFHYEIVGECYEFGNLKEVAYYRQERLKEIYLKNNVPIKVNEYNDILIKYNQSNYGRAIVFPLYYERLDTFLLVYDNYKSITGKDSGHDYDALTGTELIRYKKLNEYRLCTHVKAVDVKNSLLRGNMYYKEDRWDVQITPINYFIFNDKKSDWLLINDELINPNIILSNIRIDGLPEIEIPNYIHNNIKIALDTSTRKQAAIKDKFIKIKVRYSGKDLAIVSAINTLYRISYA